MEYLDELTSIVKEAGEVMKEGFVGLVDEKEKNELDYVTEFDVRVEKLIKKRLKEKFPNYGILAEESGEEKLSSEFRWIIDPIDGTTNFIHKIPIFSTTISLEKNGEIIFGIIYNPITKELFYAKKGEGAYLNGKKLQIKTTKEFRKWFMVWCYPDSRRNEEVVTGIFDAFYSKCKRVTKLGSATMEFAYIATNRVEGYISVGLKKWDYSAGKLIVEEAGGIVSLEKYKGNDILVTTSKENFQKIKDELGI